MRHGGSRLFVAEEYSNEVKVLDGARRLILTIGSGRAGKGPDRFDYPEGVAVWGHDVWISDTRNGRIVRYRVNTKGH